MAQKKDLYNSLISDIAKAVKKNINESTSTYCSVSNDYLYISSKINSISLKERDKVWNTCPMIFTTHLENFRLYEDVNPGDKVYPAADVARIIQKKYSMKEWQFYPHCFTETNRVECVVAIPANRWVTTMSEHIEADFDKHGYFYSGYHDIKDADGYVWRLFNFEPKHQENKAEEIRKHKVLYHITPAQNLDSILKYGFIPHSRKKIEQGYVSYPPRIFFLPSFNNEEKDEREILVMTNQIYRHTVKYKNPKQDSEYAILSLDILSIPEDIEMYYDPDSNYGIFVTKNIPADCIYNIEFYDCKKQKYIDNISRWNKMKSKILSLFKRNN